LPRRADRDLRFADLETVPPGTPILLDTCVYIDTAADRLPPAVAPLLAHRLVSHCAVCLGELAVGLGLLRPTDRRSRGNADVVMAILERAAGSSRVLEPDTEVWTTAGMVAGTLARTQGYAGEQRRRTLADALVLATARKAGQTVLTADIADFDLVQQLLPDARVAFYHSRAASEP
jgi:predicted nucleic acid-binding protein